jgi:anthranilate synthase/aminodeoxychorismate synthase-like glutamine amidotransferase
LGASTLVKRNDEVQLDSAELLAADAVIMSPGPCTPNEAGCCLDLVRHFSGRLPILGICLGHQAIVQACGGQIIRAAAPCHGRDSLMFHNHFGIMAGLPSPLRVGRYHSLVADRQSMPASLLTTGWLEDGTIMAVQQHGAPTVGLQFHPESILTEAGDVLLRNFLTLAEKFWTDSTGGCLPSKQSIEVAT